ncbi:MAG: DMT family transporter [Thalassobaculales bacterium]
MRPGPAGGLAAPDHGRGILLFCLALLLFSFLDASAKVLTQSLPLAVVVWFRYTVHFLGAAAWMAPRPGRLVTRAPWLQAWRSFLLASSTALNFLAVSHLPLTTTTAIMFLAPLLVAALSVPMLGEQVGPRRWAAILVGFIGILVVVRPGQGELHLAVIASVGAVVCGSFYNIATRQVAAIDPPDTTAFYTALFGTIFATPLLAFYWVTPEAWQWPLLIGLGFLGGIGHLLVIIAARYAPAPVVAPFGYTQIVWMAALGYLVFGEVPDFYTVLGIGIVVASGLYLLHRERVRRTAA